MMKNLVYVCALGMILFSCQSEESFISPAESEKAAHLEALEKNPCEMILVSDEVITAEDQSVSVRSSSSSDYESSIPVYRYYGSNGNKHYYGTTYLGTTCNLYGYPYQYEGSDYNILSTQIYNVTSSLYRLYNATTNSYKLESQVKYPGYVLDSFVGYVFKKPQLGTIPLRECTMLSSGNIHYVARNDEVLWLQNHGYSVSYHTIGYVYPGQWSDPHKVANTVRIAKIHSIPCDVAVKINIKDGTNTRELTYRCYLPDYSNGWAGGSSEITLPVNTWIVTSIDVTIIKYFDSGAHTYTGRITSTSPSSPGRIGEDMFVGYTSETSNEGAKTSIYIE